MMFYPAESKSISSLKGQLPPDERIEAASC